MALLQYDVIIMPVFYTSSFCFNTHAFSVFLMCYCYSSILHVLIIFIPYVTVQVLVTDDVLFITQVTS